MAYPDIPEGSHPKARWLACQVTEKPVWYPGYGRPPRFHPSVRKEEAAKRRRDAYAAKRKGVPARKRGRPTKAEVRARAAMAA